MRSKIKDQRSKIKNMGGQVVLLLVLITVVGLTIGLSLISRTVTDVRISSQIEQSGRAFSAAEAGVESVLKGTVEGSEMTGSLNLQSASADYKVNIQGNSTDVFTMPLTEVGSTQTIWLAGHSQSGILDESGYTYPVSSPIDICWSTDPAGSPAIIVSLFYQEGSSYKIAKAAYDSNSTRGNNFYQADVSGGYCGGNYRFKKTITPSSNTPDGFSLPTTNIKLLFLRIQPLYANTALAVKPAGSDIIPIQGRLITSVGKTDTGIVRKIQVFQGYQTLPTMLDFGLFTEN